MRWWTPDPHPCLGGCGIILQHPWAKRCPKCNRAHVREKEKVRYRELRERGVCVDCGRVPAFRAGRCEPHWEGNREYARKGKAKKRRRDRKFVNCESLRRPAPKEWECQVLSALLGGSLWAMATYERIVLRTEEGKKDLCAMCARGFQQGRDLGHFAKNALRRNSVRSQANLPRTEGGKNYARNAGRFQQGKDSSDLLRGMPEGQEAEGYPSRKIRKG